MKNPFKHAQENGLDRMFETRSEAWAAAGLHLEVDRTESKRAFWRVIGAVVLLIIVVAAEQAALNHIATSKAEAKAHKPPLHHFILSGTLVTVVAVLLVLILGWRISRDIAQIAPVVFRRMDPATAGTVGFVLRFVAVAATVLGALAVAGVNPQTLAVGGAFTAVILGLAAQQTLGNLFAGMVLLSARPFRLGERVRLQAGQLGGVIEGVVSSLGLLYTTLARGDDRVMIPNTLVLSSVVVPIREPDAVDVRVSLGRGVRPTQVQQLLDHGITTPTRTPPNVVLEEINGDEVVVRVQAVPERRSEGARLADEIIQILSSVSTEHPTAAGPVSEADAAG